MALKYPPEPEYPADEETSLLDYVRASGYHREPEYPADAEVSVLDYISVIVKHRRMILSLGSVAVTIAVIVSLLLPETYSATAVIMPPKSETTMSALGAKMGGLAAFAGGMLGTKPSDIYVEMLKSRVVTDAIVNIFNLLGVYEVKQAAAARKVLSGNTRITISKANTIRISVEDKDPQRAADLANAYVEELDKLGQRFNVSDAARQRMFLDKRIEETKKQLVRAESRLRGFQEQNKIVALTEQARASIYAAARIKGQIIGIETELEVLKGFVTGESNQMIRLEQKLVELKAQLTKIETGHGFNNPDDPGNHGEESNFYIPFTQVPDLGLQLGRLTRKVKIQETVFELLTQQYEMVKIAEAKDVATIQVLDKAVAPKERSGPRRSLIVGLSGMVSLFIAVSLAFISEHFERMDSQDKQLWQDIKTTLKVSIPLFGRWKKQYKHFWRK